MNISFDDINGIRYTLPFQTLSVPFSQLSKGSIIIEEEARETMSVWVFYQVVRINKKTITLRCCNSNGLPYNDKPIRKDIQSWDYTIKAPPAEE